MICTNFYRKILHISILCITFTLISCEDKNVGDFFLTGNIENMIPEEAYDLRRINSDDGKYIIYTPDLNSNFEYWGLSLERVEYYIDNDLYATEQVQPFELILNKNEMTIGTHTVNAKMTIVGEKCEDIVLEKTDEFYISETGIVSERHGDFFFEYNYVTKGEYLVITPELLLNRSTEGCEIDKVRYYFDGTLISTESVAPFALNYLVNEEVGSSHTIGVTIDYHDNENSNIIYNWSYVNYTICDEDDAFIYWDIKSNRNDYVNGEIISLTTRHFKGNNVQVDFEVEFYLDGKLIGHSTSFPYILNYTLSGLKIGAHTITGKTILKYKDHSTSSSSDETIIITK